MGADRQLSKKIEIMMAVDENYYLMASVAMASILRNAAPDDLLTFHILDGGMSEHARNQILALKSIREFECAFYQPNVDEFRQYFPNFQNYATFFRLVVARLLPESVERLIYLDCDILVLSSLRELWETPLNGTLCAAAYDVYCRKNAQEELGLPDRYRYFNAGVLLIDLKFWRENDLTSEFVRIAREREGVLTLADQDILNLCALKYGYVELGESWNLFAGDVTDLSSTNVLHYWCGLWLFAPSGSLQQRLLDEYAALTPFKKLPHRTFWGDLRKRWIVFCSAFILHGRNRRAFRRRHIAKIRN